MASKNLKMTMKISWLKLKNKILLLAAGWTAEGLEFESW
jgi:hypothetical protein